MELECGNASHVFADFLAIFGRIYAEEQYRVGLQLNSRISQRKPENDDNECEAFCVNVLDGNIRLFWTALPSNYISHVVNNGRPLKEHTIQLFHSRQWSILSRHGLKAFAAQFLRVVARRNHKRN
jgi:hypothetical protein